MTNPNIPNIPTDEHLTVLDQVRSLVDRPVRWRGVKILEVFNADVIEQKQLYRQLKPLRDTLEAVAGGTVTIIFHTRTQSQKLYADFLASS